MKQHAKRGLYSLLLSLGMATLPLMAIQHTGSWGESATLLHSLQVAWK